jgi:hypothetical protein
MKIVLNKILSFLKKKKKKVERWAGRGGGGVTGNG